MASALDGRRILIVEDEYLLAETLRDAIERAGGVVIGPAPSIAAALRSLSGEAAAPDAATLNVRVTDGESYPVADALARLAVPFVFASANSMASLPPRFARRPLVAKPFSGRQIVAALEALLD